MPGKYTLVSLISWFFFWLQQKTCLYCCAWGPHESPKDYFFFFFPIDLNHFRPRVLLLPNSETLSLLCIPKYLFKLTGGSSKERPEGFIKIVLQMSFITSLRISFIKDIYNLMPGQFRESKQINKQNVWHCYRRWGRIAESKNKSNNAVFFASEADNYSCSCLYCIPLREQMEDTKSRKGCCTLASWTQLRRNQKSVCDNSCKQLWLKRRTQWDWIVLRLLHIKIWQYLRTYLSSPGAGFHIWL